ncbi:hypothetical protein [Arthrobacter sp. UYCo732]|uniref:DUF7007 domain-containing protein n=1 Tax=Arthrobacter sp. UYCo732 TaxID=3156336 RepID=UPI00339B8A46
MTITPSRQPAGVPVGGQFAAITHSEPELALPAKVTPFHDADGTDWEFGGDEYTDIYTSFTDGIEAHVSVDIREGGARAKVIDRRGPLPRMLANQQHFDSLDEAKAHAKSVRSRAVTYGTNGLSVGGDSPWGEIQEIEAMAPGMDVAYTAGHGGLKLTPERNAEVDPAWREGSWYEEDCAWSKAVLTHHADLPEDYVTSAHETARRWYPDEYEAVVGKDPAKYGLQEYRPITASESHIIADRHFFAARASTHDKVQDVQRDIEGHPGKIAVTLSDIPADGRETGDDQANVRTILVPEAEWNLAHTEKLTFPKTDKYETLPPGA